MAIPWLGIAKIAAPILGGLFGGKKETKQRLDLGHLVKEAQENGFNPLTVMRNGGIAGSSKTIHPSMSSGEFIGQALGVAGEVFDPIAQERDDLEIELLRGEVARLNDSSYISPALAVGGGYAQTVQSDHVDIYNRPDIGYPDGLDFAGQRLAVNPNFSDAGTLSERYGEIVEMLGGLGVLAGDVYQTAKPSLPVWGDAMQAGIERFQDRMAPPSLMTDAYGDPVLNPFTGNPVHAF